MLKVGAWAMAQFNQAIYQDDLEEELEGGQTGNAFHRSRDQSDYFSEVDQLCDV